jgi:hypothetical protein
LEDHPSEKLMASIKSKAHDFVRVADAGFAQLRNRLGSIVAGRQWEPLNDKDSVVHVEGWVSLVMRQNGKIVPGSRRDGHNIWTNSGREFLALLMSIQTPPTTPFRNDRVAYIGVGTGSQPEDAGVLNLVQPVAFVPGQFMAPLDVPPSFPLSPSRTTVRYHRTFVETDITFGGSAVAITELGLFTNGSPQANPPYNPGSRDVTIGNAAAQAPVAYKTFEPVQKTSSLQLEVSWEIRF